MTSSRAVVAALALAALAGCGNLDEEVDARTTSTVTPVSTPDREQDHPSDSYDDEAVFASMQADWGLQDKEAVGGALARVTDRYPQAYGGGSYDADTLQYTEWVVEDAEGAAEMRAKTKAAFEKVAGESNLVLQFASAPKPLTLGAEVQEQLLRAVHNDRRWPTDLALTGSWDFASGTYLIEAGDRHDDPDVVAYLATTWDGLVIATATEPNQPEMINTGDGG